VCCAVRVTLVVPGGDTSGGEVISSVNMLSKEEGAFTAVPPLSCGGKISDAAAVTVEESGSVAR